MASERDAAVMQGAVLAGPELVDISAVPVPAPGPKQVRVRLEGSGVCGSELPAFEGRPWFEYPFDPGAPGHEGWGVIDAVGEDVRSVSVGQRVAALSYRAHAEFDIAEESSVVPLPSELDGSPFPGEALACAMNVFDRSDIRAGDTVAIVGIGFLGALLTQLVSDAGARVFAITRRTSALEVASSMGAAETIQAGDPDAVIAEVESLTGGGLCDRVIEVTGKQQPLDAAARATRVRGRLVIAGFHQDGERTVDMQLWNWRGLDVVNAHERDPAVYVKGLRAAIQAVCAGALDPGPLYTHVFPLDRLHDALSTAMERPEGFMKALVLS